MASSKKPFYTPRQSYPDRSAITLELFKPLEVKMSTIETTLLLLDSKEDNVLTTIFRHITEFMLKQDKNVLLLRSHNLLDLLVDKEMFIDSSNTLIRRFALYEADLIIETMNTLIDLDTERAQEIVDLALRYYLKETDDFCVEYLSVIINKCCDDPLVGLNVIKDEEFREHFYDHIKRTANPDVLFQSFEALHKMLQVLGTDEQIETVMDPEFPLDRILCEITNEYSELRTASLRLVRILISDASEENRIAVSERSFYLLEQLTKAFRSPIMSSTLKDVVDAYAATVRTEPMTKRFFERNFFEKLIGSMRSAPNQFAGETMCHVLSIFAETAKFSQFLYRLHMADVTDMFVECVVSMEGITTPPALHILLGLNRLMKFTEAASRIVAAYEKSLLVKLLQILTSNLISVKSREQVAELLGNLLNYSLVTTAEELLLLDYPVLLGEVLASPMEELSPDLIMSLLSTIETFAQNEEHRSQLCKETSFTNSLALLLQNSFSTAMLTAKTLRCLTTIIDEPPVRNSLLKFFLSNSLKRALKSLSNVVKSAATNFIMQTTRFPACVAEYVKAGVLEVLILNQKHSHCVSTWGPAIDSILSKTPSLKFCIRNNLGFNDSTAGDDFYVSKKKFEDFREFQSILTEEVSPLFPVFIVNFKRERNPADQVKHVTPAMFVDENMGAGFAGWVYCRRPGDSVLPQYLESLHQTLEEFGLRGNAASASRCIDFDNLAKRVKIVAELVAEGMGNNLEPLDLNSPHECCEQTVKCHLKEICHELHCSIIPLGKVSTGCMFERAVLFKCLADQIGLPATLQRSVDGRVLFNEVPLPVQEERDVHCDAKTLKFMPWRMLRPTHLVDLMFNIGELYPMQSRQALQYLRLY